MKIMKNHTKMQPDFAKTFLECSKFDSKREKPGKPQRHSLNAPKRVQLAKTVRGYPYRIRQNYLNR